MTALAETSLAAGCLCVPTTAKDAWAPGPLRPLLTPGAIHVWRADLTAVAEEVCELLCEDERDRGERILRARERELWRRSRGLLRVLIGRYLQQDPRSPRFAAGPHGKPELVQSADAPPAAARRRSPERPSGLRFNLTHSGGLALYAFSAMGPVGVDVEVARRPINEVAIAARVFGVARAQRLEGLDPALRQREFRRMWVTHEAELKCVGVGIGGVGDPLVADEPGAAHTPWITELDLGPSAAGAVAAECRPLELRCWSW